MHFDVVSLIIGILAALAIAIPATTVISSAIRKKKYDEKVGTAEEKARQIIDDAVKNAEAKKRESMLEIKEESIRSKNELDKEIKERRNEIQNRERRITQREENLEKKVTQVEKREAEFIAKERELDVQREEIAKLIVCWTREYRNLNVFQD